MPALYDLAFGYRDFDQEVDFLLARHEQISGSAATTVLEVAAGPARHAIAALECRDTNNKIEAVHCVDLSPEMAAYAQQLAADVLPPEQTLLFSKFHYHVADMRDFTLFDDDNNNNNRTTVVVDTAWLLLGSLQHLTTNTDVIHCLESIHRAVRDGGTLWVELPHPRETFAMVDCTRNGWKVPLDLTTINKSAESLDDDNDDEDETSTSSSTAQLEIVWGDQDDDFDPITQVRQFTVAMELTGDNIPPELLLLDDPSLPQQQQPTTISIREVVPMRLFTAQEIDALARCAGWKVVAMYGALEEDVTVDDEQAAFRLVCALQKQ